MLAQMRFTKLTVRYMCNAVNRVTTGKYRNSMHDKQIVASQNDSNEKPAEWDTAKPYSDIPGPKSIPVLGNLWRFLPVVGTYAGLDRLSQQKKMNQEYGSIVKLSGLKLKPDLIILFEPKDIEMMHRNEGVWPHREGMGSVAYYKLKMRQDVFHGQGGVLTSHGKEWFETRRVVNAPLMQPRSIHQYIGTVDSVTQDFIQRVDSLVATHPQGEMPKDFHNELAKWATESVHVIGLNKRLGLLNANLSPESAERTFINDVFELFVLLNELNIKVSFWRWFSTPTWRRYAKTSKLVGAALYFLAKNQKAQERLRAEIRTVLLNKDSPVTKEALFHTPYLRAVIKETTRKAPIFVGNIRRMPKETVIGGYQIPKGINVMSANLALSFQDKYFPRAHEFIPERWLKGQNEQYISRDASSFASLPFGFGPRSCVGRSLAQMELEIILARMVRNYSWTWPHEDMKWVNDLFYGVGSPLQYHMKPASD